MNRRPRLELHGSTASPEEAAAVIAAIEQFLRDTAPPPAPPARGREPVAPRRRGSRPSSATRASTPGKAQAAARRQASPGVSGPGARTP